MTAELPVTGGRLRPASLIASTLVTLLVVVVVLVLAQAPLMGAMEELVRTRPLTSVAVFVGFMGLWSLTTLSAIPFLILAGSVFGPWLGALFALAGLMAGTLATFIIGKRWRGLLERLAGRYERLRRILDLVERRPVVAVLLVRGVVGFPLSLLRYGLAAAGVSRRDYLVGSVLAILPGVVLYTGLGGLLAEVLHEGRLTGGTVAALAVAAALTLWLALVIRRRAADQRSV